jgi:hypothetical protein
MTDNVIPFPNQNESPDIDPDVKELIDLLTEDAVQGETRAYPMTILASSTTELEQVHDLETTGKRNRRWGAMVQFNVLPHIDRLPVGPVSLPMTPSQFIDADNLEDLRERLFAEVDKSIRIAELARDNPDKLGMVEQLVQMQVMQRHAAEQANGQADQ